VGSGPNWTQCHTKKVCAQVKKNVDFLVFLETLDVKLEFCSSEKLNPKGNSSQTKKNCKNSWTVKTRKKTSSYDLLEADVYEWNGRFWSSNVYPDSEYYISTVRHQLLNADNRNVAHDTVEVVLNTMGNWCWTFCHWSIENLLHFFKLDVVTFWSH
jgi:hypothetical protein